MPATELTTDHSTFAVLVGVVFGLIRILEYCLRWVSEKVVPPRQQPITVVQLSPEISQMLRDTHHGVQEMQRVLDRTDQDGVPLVYAPRAHGETLSKVSEVVSRIESEVESIDKRTEHMSLTLAQGKK